MLPKFDGMYDEFRKYKHKISTYGTILMNQDCTRVLLCQAYFGNSWTFPAGKVNQHETGVEAGARETYEETGFDPNCLTGEAKRLREEADEKGESLSWSNLQFRGCSNLCRGWNEETSNMLRMQRSSRGVSFCSRSEEGGEGHSMV